MKKEYVKPGISVLDMEVENNLMAASGEFKIVDPGEKEVSSETDMYSTGPSFNIWGGDEE